MPPHRKPARRGIGGARGAGSDEFAQRLRALGVRPLRDHCWLGVGQPARVAGWKLHVSASIAGIEQLFGQVLPCLTRARAHFKIVADRDAWIELGAGAFGDEQIGKVITVYPRDDEEAVALADLLIERTHGLAGPCIATDLHIGNAVYARYGAVRPRIVYDRFGEATELIPDGRGNWFPDRRTVPFVCPPGISNPFRRQAPSAASGLPARAPLGGRYFVTDVLHPRLSGSVLRAIDLNNSKGPSPYVLKQARPHCAEDDVGRDRRARLRHEARMLARLQGLKGIAPAGEYFEEEGNGYLPVAYVPGKTLADLVYRQVAGRPWRRLAPATRRRLLGYATQLVRRLCAAHARGVIHRDLSPGNVWIGADDQVYLIDWECAHARRSRRTPFHLGTPGFSDPGDGRRIPACRDDWQACGRVLMFMITGFSPAALVHGGRAQLQARLATLTELPLASVAGLAACSPFDGASRDPDAQALRRAIAAVARAPARHPAPLFLPSRLASTTRRGLEWMATRLRDRLDRLGSRAEHAVAIDAHSGVAGLLYVLAAADSADVSRTDRRLCARAIGLLTRAPPPNPDLPGLAHGSAGRALAVAAAVQAGLARADEALLTWLGVALAGRLDWPDFTHA